MSSIEYPRITLFDRRDPADPAIGGVAPLTAMRWVPFRQILRSQDRLVGATARVVAEYSLEGAEDFATPNAGTNPDPGTGAAPQAYPDIDEWRTVRGPLHVRLTPGAMLEAHVLYAPSGLSQRFAFSAAAGGNVWMSGGNVAYVRIKATFRSADGASSSGPWYAGVSLEGSPLGQYTGLEPDGFGGLVGSLKEKLIERIEPPSFESDEATARLYSELATAEVEIQVRGGERIVHCVVYEVPRVHVQAHDDTGLFSVHVAPKTNSPKTNGPDTRVGDLGFEHHRWGLRRVMEVAERQGTELGPRVLHWGDYDVTDAAIYQETVQPGISVSSATWVDLLDNSLTAWDANSPGWVVAGSMAQLHRLCEPVLIGQGKIALIPVTVTVEATYTQGGGSDGGDVRLQSGPFEWVDLNFDNDGVREEKVAHGYLESQVYADHAWGVLQAFGQVDGMELTIHNVSIDFGHY